MRLNFFVKFVSFVISNYQLSIINCQLNKGYRLALELVSCKMQRGIDENEGKVKKLTLCLQ